MQIILTIGIPAFLHHSGVHLIISSLQNRSDIEIVVSEDVPIHREGIRDLPNWSNIIYSDNTPPLGAVPNWNAILKIANGQFVWLIHHDEVPHFPNGLDAFMRYLKETDAGFLVSYLKSREDSFLQRVVRYDPFRRMLLRFPASILFQNYIGSPSNVIIRKRYLEAFDENLKWFVDVEWFFRVLKRADAIELSKFEVTSLPYELSITSGLASTAKAISLSEIDYIFGKHHLNILFRRIWQFKVCWRDIYRRRCKSA